MNSFALLCVLFLGSSIWVPCFALERSSKVLIPSDRVLSLLDPEEDPGRATTDQAVMKANEDGDGRKLKASENISLTEKTSGKGAGGKGSNGGTSNVVHQRPGEKNAATALFFTPYFALSFVILGLL